MKPGQTISQVKDSEPDARDWLIKQATVMNGGKNPFSHKSPVRA
jgi:hypothetical protein